MTRPRTNDGPSPGLIVHASGGLHSRLYVLGERAGKNEYLLGAPFVGDSGDTLREWFESAALDWNDCRLWNVCIDYQERNRKPLVWELERDRPAVEADIARCKPKVIVAVGAYATRWCLKTRSNLGDVHGQEFEVQIGDHKAVCVPIYHPSRLQRGDRSKKGKTDVLTVERVLRGLIAEADKQGAAICGDLMKGHTCGTTSRGPTLKLHQEQGKISPQISPQIGLNFQELSEVIRNPRGVS